MKQIKVLKAKVKELGAELKRLGREIKNPKAPAGITSRRHWKRVECRSYHIAYCELLGHTRDRIEKPRPDNPADEVTVARIKAQYAEPAPEVVQ